MHAALQHRVILNEIFDYLTPPLEPECDRDHHYTVCYPDKDAQKVLYCAALTCTAFREPALKQLWRHVTTFDALLGLLPSSVKVVSDVSIHDRHNPAPDLLQYAPSVWVVDGPVTEAERARFIWYAKHIRALHLHTQYRIDPTVFHHLAHARLGRPLAPQLRALYSFRGGPPCMNMAVALLSGPALSALALMFPPADATVTDDRHRGLPLNHHLYALRGLLANVAASAPGLKLLAVHTCTHASLLEPIGAMHNLRWLELWEIEVPFGMDLLRTLAGLDQLQQLLLPDTFDARGATPCSGFKSVKSLTVSGGARTVPSLLAVLPDLQLRGLCLDLAFSAEEMIASLYVIADALRKGSEVSLEELELRMGNSITGSALSRDSVSTVFEPFSAFQGIQVLELKSDEPMMISDQDLRKIGRTWPKLDMLDIRNFYDEMHLVSPTIRGIIKLANACPRLASVYFPGVKPTVDAASAIGPLRTKDFRKTLLDVRVPDEQIRDVGQLARVLHSVFETLQIVNLDRDQYGKWGAVLDEMARLQGNK
ncbi:hypothetical protein FOMPIDRAFT_1056421 [Fomitopsis schrenkii]|uniref:F-box domain-containing protein n=1 Tax=Fomitopsis schrenkii TaxID=2126942 RepID=S8DHD1_FOMSC|nr:hypothetical protein FOMPIDRAFT_1056421 [Fomitopsis schrenkii]